MESRPELVEALCAYTTNYHEEAVFIDRFLSLLKDNNCYKRTHLPGHLTGSAWIIDPTHTKVVLTHHAKLNKWLQPGGHADGDENILRVALKETEEETGLVSLKFLLQGIFDIDIHTIPERKDFPQHNHYDIRFLFEANDVEPLLISEESHDLAWINLNELAIYNNNQSLLRMAEKVKQLF